ncbi:hypothetical protein DTW90_20080 [Neorhizobium sp. P12A]|nr:hypothetical protein DTW90_20080 [Neorhizobium sp. P12A]
MKFIYGSVDVRMPDVTRMARRVALTDGRSASVFAIRSIGQLGRSALADRRPGVGLQQVIMRY